MIVGIPSSGQPITNDTFYVDTVWFSFFQNVWKAIRGSLGISLTGMLSINTTSVSNVTTGETTLISYTSPSNTLTNLGDVLEIDAWGKYAANGNNKTVILYFGSQAILTTGAIAANDGTWSIKAKIIRTAASTQEIVSELLSSNSSVSDSATRTEGTQNLSTDLIIRCTGTGGASSDIIQYALKINLTPNS